MRLRRRRGTVVMSNMPSVVVDVGVVVVHWLASAEKNVISNHFA